MDVLRSGWRPSSACLLAALLLAAGGSGLRAQELSSLGADAAAADGDMVDAAALEPDASLEDIVATSVADPAELTSALPADEAEEASSEEVAADPGRGSVTGLPLPRYVSLRAGSANARRGPSLDQRIDWEFLKRGLPLRITAEYGQWRRVEDADGLGGWVHQALLSGVRMGLVQGAAPVALKAQASEPARTLALAEPGVIVRLEACADGWCRVSAGGVDGWMPRTVVWGVDPDESFD